MKAITTVLNLFPVFFFIMGTHAAWSQCPSGAIGISGGGCMSGCDLTASGGPNCSPPVTGNTTTTTVFTNITVPNGCTFTVTATMMNRAGGCSASGADAADGMKVDIPGGPKSFQTGASNATLNDSYVLIGPGIIRVSCTANRQDEIVTYSVTSAGTFCTACMSILPIELGEFNAVPGVDYVDLTWVTFSERDNDYFTMERSPDGFLFEAIGTMPGAGNSSAPIQYTSRDPYPLEGTSYYRLRQTDYNGETTYSDIRSVRFDFKTTVYPNPANDQLVIAGKNLAGADVAVLNALGQQIGLAFFDQGEQRMYDTRDLPEGFYFICITSDNGERITYKIGVTHPD